MKNIDFLPGRFRENHAATQALIKRWTIAIGLATFIVPLALYQFVAHRSIVLRLAEIGPEYNTALLEQTHLHQVQDQLKLAQGEAALLAYLQHPWPRSQILAKIHEPLPESVRLTGVKLLSELRPSSSEGPVANRSRRSRRADPRESDVDSKRPVAEQDLQALAEMVSSRQVVVMLTGITLNPTELHTYVAHLRASGLFDKSELRSVEKITGGDDRTQKFEIRLVVSPGYGSLERSTPLLEEPPSDAPLAKQVRPDAKLVTRWRS